MAASSRYVNTSRTGAAHDVYQAAPKDSVILGGVILTTLCVGSQLYEMPTNQPSGFPSECGQCGVPSLWGI